MSDAATIYVLYTPPSSPPAPTAKLTQSCYGQHDWIASPPSTISTTLASKKNTTFPIPTSFNPG